MELTLRFLLFLRKLASFFRKRWAQSIRGLWHIFAFVRILPRRPKGRDEARRRIEYRPANPPTTVICASRLPLPLTPIPGGDTPIASPLPISIQVRHPTILDTDTIYEAHRDSEHLGVDGYFLEGSGSISRSPDSANHRHEPESIHVVLPPYRKDYTSDSPVTPSRPLSGHSHRPPSLYSGYRPSSQHSYRSPTYLGGAEAAARGYSNGPPPTPSSPALSIRPPSVAGSVASYVYRASRPTTRVQRPSPMRNASRRRTRSSTPASARQSVHNLPPELPQPESWTSGSAHRGRPGPAVSFGLVSPVRPKDKLRPMIGIDRYEKHKMVIIEDVIIPHVISPVTTQFVRDSTPDNWIPLMHPEGALYWTHVTEPIYTDTNMCDPALRQEIEQSVQEIRKLRDNSPFLPEDWELALELGEDYETGELVCSYYFACHSTRCLFWLHELDLENVLEDLCGVTEKTHIHLALQALYWSHWEMFPHNREVPEALFQELSGILLYAGVDCMTSSNSTAIYSEPELNKLLAYVRYIKRVGGNFGFSACVVGRLMYFFTHSRYINFYGQKGARLSGDQTIYGLQPKRTWLIKTLSVFFFYAPELHLRGLESVYTDFIICQYRWVDFITRLQSDWAEFVLYGTVLLVANVGFLAIQSVDPGSYTRTSPQLASYLSIIATGGSIGTGLLLLRQHRTKPQDAAEEVDHYLRSRHHKAIGFETLAILYSLPYSLLLWAAVSFFTAFGLEVLLYSSELWARLPVAVVFAIMVLLISWCIWTTLEAKTDFSLLGRVHVLKDWFAGFTRGLRGETSEPRSDDGDDGGRSGTLKGVFTRLRSSRHRRMPSTSSTLVNASGSHRSRLPDETTVEMDGINTKEPSSAV